MGTFVENVNSAATVIVPNITEILNADTNAGIATAQAAIATAMANVCTSTYDQFDDRYLGAKATAPLVDNDGNALVYGTLYFDTTQNFMKVWSNAGWINAGSSVNGTTERYVYSATAGQTVFVATYEAGYIDVFLNGSKLQNGVDFTAITATNITLTSPASLGDVVDIICYAVFELSTAPTKDVVAYTVNTVADLASVPSSYTTAIVKDLDIGGTFIWSSTGTANGGTIFVGATGYWNRQYSGAINVKWFGTKSDGITDDRLIIQNAISTLQSGDTLIIPKGEFKVINATGVGATSVIARANAVLNNTLFSLKSAVNNININIEGTITATSELDNVFYFTGTNVKIYGNGKVVGNGVVIDTNSADPLLQWYPSLIRIDGAYSSVIGISTDKHSTVGIYLFGSNQTARNNQVIGGSATHGVGTILMGIASGNAAGGSVKNQVIGNKFTLGSLLESSYTAVYNTAENSIISDNIGSGLLEHGVYNYGADTLIANNIFDGTATRSMLAGIIQSFASNCKIIGNSGSYSTGGISIASCSNTIVSNNIFITGISQTGISVRRYTSDATSTTYKNINITDNTIELLNPTQQGIDIALDNNLDGLLLTGNIVSNSKETYGGITVRNAGSGVIRNVLIKGNEIKSCLGFGIYLDKIETFSIDTNILTNCNETTSNIAIMLNTYCITGKIINNIVSDTRATKLTSRIVYALGTGNSYLTVLGNTAKTLLATTDTFCQMPTLSAKSNNTVDGNPTVGTFVVTNSVGVTITAPVQTQYGGGTDILLIPINKDAIDLQAGANRIYVSSWAAGSFTWLTSSGAVSGSTTAKFRYEIIQ